MSRWAGSLSLQPPAQPPIRPPRTIPRVARGAPLNCAASAFCLHRDAPRLRSAGLLRRFPGLHLHDHLPIRLPGRARAPSPSAGGAFAPATTTGGALAWPTGTFRVARPDTLPNGCGPKPLFTPSSEHVFDFWTVQRPLRHMPDHRRVASGALVTQGLGPSPTQDHRMPGKPG